MTVGETDKSLGFFCNGGDFVEGCQVPDSYPVQKLPEGSDINKPGYAFAGWYDNADCKGNAVTEVSDTDYTGPVVLYAKWTDAYYYIDIPANVAAVRSALGCASAFDILPAVWITSLFSAGLGVCAAWLLGKVWGE